MMKLHTREEGGNAAINLTPLIDMVFILLIFFAVNSSFVKFPGVDVDQPSAKTTTVQPSSTILIAVTDAGDIWIDKKKVDVRRVRGVIERMTAFMTESQVQPGAPNPLSQLSEERLEGSRKLVAEMIGAAPGEIVFGPSTTLNVYVLAQALRPTFAPGDEIVVTNQDHEANGGAWRRLAEFGLTVREWRIDPKTGELDPADLDGLLSARTRLVCFPHVSNIVGGGPLTEGQTVEFETAQGRKGPEAVNVQAT